MASGLSWIVTRDLNLFKWSRWTKCPLTIWHCNAESKNSPHFANCIYLSLTKSIAAANRICEGDFRLKVRKTLLWAESWLKEKENLKIEITFTRLRNSYPVCCIFPQECGSDWCRWRLDCVTYCPASRWRHAKTRLSVLFLTQNLPSWQSAESYRWYSNAYSYETTYMVTWWFM